MSYRFEWGLDLL